LQAWRDQGGLRSTETVDGTLRLVLNNSLAAVEDGRSAIVRFLGPIDSRALNRLEVLFEEMVTNTVRHGFDKGSDQSIHVAVTRGPGAITLVFEDDGIAFDPTASEEAMRQAHADAERVGGLGIPLILKLSTSLRYERLSAAGDEDFQPRNRVTASLAVQSAAAEEDV
jgi:anti-sigma regulatory factor (Ser/Thr protein kinase)